MYPLHLNFWRVKLTAVKLPSHLSLLCHFFTCSVTPSCDCGQRQTVNHIVNTTCALTKLEGGLNLLHEVDDDAVMRLESTATAALAK